MNHEKTNTYYVMDFGAAGDGIHKDTVSIQRAVDTCSAKGGGIVYFSSGYRFLTGTIYLDNNITLFIAKNSILLGSTEVENYCDDTGICPYYPEPLDRCLVYGKDKKNISFTGPGTIDGQFRESFLDKHDNPLETDKDQRPMLIRLENCSHISMKDLHIKGAYSWCVHLKYCKEVKIHHLTISNDRQDGLNIESSENITISDCTLYCGDDGIALTTSNKNKPLKNLTVTNCIISSRWAGIRLGPLSKGNFENIIISNCVLQNCGGGGIKIGMFEGAEIKNCIFSSIIMDRVTAPILIMNTQWTDIGSLDQDPKMMPLGKIRNLHFTDMQITAHAGPTAPWDQSEYSQNDLENFLKRPDRNSTIFLHGHRDAPLENIFFRNINVTFPGGVTKLQAERSDLVDMHEIDIHANGYWTEDKDIWGIPLSYALFCRHINNSFFSELFINLEKDDERPPIAFYNSKSIELNRIWVASRKAKREDIHLINCGDHTS
ncbi:MAG: right-handed parallel beta-helix repeat-containing protein [Bacteroidetes bacterium]|nr:right-handed parallel beta-helix repeat-containing protein [Bacteroidota bacterium]